MRIPKGLVEQVRRGNGIAFIGSGLSSSAGLPTWSQLLWKMRDYCLEHQLINREESEDLEVCLNRRELLLAAEEIKERMSKYHFQKCLTSIFRDSRPKPKPLHKLLLSIPFCAILTSNYDNLIESAYTLANSGVSAPTYTHTNINELVSAQQTKLYILKLHGTIDNPGNIIFGGKDYRNLLFSNQSYRQYISYLFTNRTALFLGYSLKDPDLLNLLDNLQEIFDSHTPEHYALIETSGITRLHQRRFLRDYGIDIIPYRARTHKHPEVSEFIAELKDRATGTNNKCYQESPHNDQTDFPDEARPTSDRSDNNLRPVHARTTSNMTLPNKKLLQILTSQLKTLSEDEARAFLQTIQRVRPVDLAYAFLDRNPDAPEDFRALRALASLLDNTDLDGPVASPVTDLFSSDITNAIRAINEISHHQMAHTAIILAAFAFDPHTSHSIYNAALDALHSFGTLAVKPCLILMGHSPRVRQEAISYILKPLGKGGILSLQEYLSSPSPVLRKGAALAAGILGNEKLMENLERACLDPVPSVSTQARESLREIKHAHGPFSKFHPKSSSDFKIVGSGEIGCKAKALAFLSHHLATSPDYYRHLFKVPFSLAIASSDFDQTVRKAKLGALGEEFDFQAVAQRLRQVELDEDIEETIKSSPELADLSRPLVVRSSSILEGNLRYSLAGLYATVWVPIAQNIDERVEDIKDAVRTVQASIWNEDVKEFRAKWGIELRDDKMGILIQPVIGRFVEQRYYPLASGLALSRNFYPWIADIPRDAPLIRIVYGLGTLAVGRGPASIIAPGHPALGEMLREYEDDPTPPGQTKIDYLDPNQGRICSAPLHTIVKEDTESDQVVQLLERGQFFDIGDRDSASDKPIFATFRPLLNSGRLGDRGRWLQEMTQKVEDIFGYEVAIEFALKESKESAEPSEPGIEINVLQARPLETWRTNKKIEIPEVAPSDLLVHSEMTLGNYERSDIKFIVSVEPKATSPRRIASIQGILRDINRKYARDGYVLIGPGWWGTSVPGHGIPVTFAHISNTCALVEILSQGVYEPSLGGHLITNLIENSIPLFSIGSADGDSVNRQWLDEQPSELTYESIKVIRVPAGLNVAVDGRERRGIIYLS